MTFTATIANRLLIADGDTRGELINRGWDRFGFCEAANLERPEWVRDIAEAFLDAGAQILIANTAAANSLAVAEQPEAGEWSPDRIAEMARRGAEICRRAVSEFPAKDRFAVGAIGPISKLLVLEEISPDDLATVYQNQARSLAAGGIDAILCRGFTELAALQIAVRAARDTGLPVVATMAFDAGADQTETTLGVSVPQMCEALGGQPTSAGLVSAVGCDGGESPDSAARVVALFKQSSELPIWCAVDAGLPQLIDGRAVHPETPEQFAERLTILAAAGANIIAGRRGVSPAHIAALVKVSQSPKRRR